MTRITYLTPECAEGLEACTSYGNLSDHAEWRGPQVRVTLIDEATGSDYSGGTHTRSNYEVMLADPEMRPHLIDLHGGYGTYGLAYRGTWDELRDDESRSALRDAVSALSDYPILDDNHHSNMECEAEGEAWDSDGRQDFRLALAKVLYHFDVDMDGGDEEYDLDGMPDAELDDLWHTGCEWLNVNGGSGHTFEEGGGCYFYVNEWLDKATSLGRDLGPGWAKERRSQLRARLSALAIATRVPE